VVATTARLSNSQFVVDKCRQQTSIIVRLRLCGCQKQPPRKSNERAPKKHAPEREIVWRETQEVSLRAFPILINVINVIIVMSVRPPHVDWKVEGFLLKKECEKRKVHHARCHDDVVDVVTNYYYISQQKDRQAGIVGSLKYHYY
jgi:hypothetical protein